MPKLGLLMTEGAVVRWLIADGQPVEQGEPIVAIMTKKITYRVVAPIRGTLAHIAQVDETVLIGESLALIVAPGEPPPTITNERVSSQLLGLPTAIGIARERTRERQTMQSASLALRKDLGLNLAPTSREQLAETSMLADQMLQHIRELSHDLRPTMLDELGLLPTLRWYISRFARRLDIKVEFETFGLEDRLAAEIETVLYRIVQEALTNIARHAQARRLFLHLERTPLRVIAVIEDDGIGFDVQRWLAAATPGLGAGLFGMRERVTLRGGVFTIDSHPGLGTRLFIELPLTPPSAERGS